jgi:type I restriction enzyme S subunit
MKNPKVRFKDSNGQDFPDWESKKFRDITIPVRIRNKECAELDIYSINNQTGFVPQSEQFEDAGYLKNTDTSIYMIVPPNHFAYNPARINVGSIGYQNIGFNVQVSSLYEVFKTTNNCYDKFIWHWFHTNIFKRAVLKYAEGGVRFYYYYDKLCETKINLPCLEEQEKIAEFLTAFDVAITKTARELELYRTLKKGLLQQLFT